ncbi:uncharacterized protein [Amphiura filiformis]|uniref:uncharacterized protein n=1 Tax=Amphiura filiformis TaxID=82378 RepID=UPI003B21D263
MKATATMVLFPELQSENDTIASQLLLLPQNITKNPCENDRTCNKDSVNINVVWLDSTSHSHFYRSMPKTVQILRDIKESGSLNVFSYNLMQSLKGGTYVNTVAFTSGKIFSRSYLQSKKRGIGNLFNLFQNGGYHVSMIDDLCWTWSAANCACGIPTFMGVKTQSWISEVVLGKRVTIPELWGNFSKELKLRGLNDIGASLANCEIMKANGITDPFFTGKSKVAICYNGLYQTDYLMSSLELLQSQLNRANRPHFSYLDINLGHESTGRRIQTLDVSLAKFMSFLGRQNNTLTFMFGDHGNKYGTFVQKSKESKIEMAHPVLFVLASNDVATKLGRDWMRALDINQNRLVNILDLRQTVLSLAPNVDVESFPINAKYDNHPNGLFHPISRKRSCDSMGIAPEAGKCICYQGRVLQRVSNQTGVVVLANFALGELNNKIQEQFLAANGNESSGFGNCRYLIGSWITNVQQTVSQNITITEMDIHIPAGTGAPQSEDVFSVTIQVGSNIPALSTNIKLVHHERISTYAVYDDCRDVGVDGDLCVCSATPTLQSWHIDPPTIFGYISTVINLTRYLYIYERRTPHGLNLETSCDSADKTFEVVMRITSKVNVGYSKKYPLTFKVKHGTIFFIDVFYQLNPKLNWDVKYDVDFKQL